MMLCFITILFATFGNALAQHAECNDVNVTFSHQMNDLRKIVTQQNKVIQEQGHVIQELQKAVATLTTSLPLKGNF